jgi:ABC-2 type transport system permease protein
MKDWTFLLFPKMLAFRQRFREPSLGAKLKIAFLTALAIGFWVLTFLIFQKVLLYFRSIELLGDFLTARLLAMLLLTFFSILFFSSLISSLSIFFLSEDLNLILSHPVSLDRVYWARLTETLVYSSWMVLLFVLPIFLAYGWVYESSLEYYLAILFALAPFLFIPSALGTIISMILVNVFPARRTKDILFFLALLLGVGLYFLFRFLQPERLINPDSFSGLVEYMSAMNAPSWPFLPSFWITESLLPILQKKSADTGLFLACLWSTAGALGVIGSWVSRAIFFAGWTKSQEARRTYLARVPAFTRFLAWISYPLKPQRGALVLKDFKSFFRDTAQWSQLILLLALVIVYLYNFSVLPLDRAPMPTIFLQNLISFLNMGLAGFVLAAVCGRFALPAVSQEGFSIWVIRSAPIPLDTFLWSKFWTSLVPLLLLAEILILFSNWLLGVTPFVSALSAITIFFMTFGIVGMAVGCGAVYPRFRAENMARMAWGFGGAVYMILTMIFITGVVVLEAWPVYTIFMATIHHRTLSMFQWAGIFFSFTGVALLIGVATFLPMKLGLKSLQKMDF